MIMLITFLSYGWWKLNLTWSSINSTGEGYRLLSFPTRKSLDGDLRIACFESIPPRLRSCAVNLPAFSPILLSWSDRDGLIPFFRFGFVVVVFVLRDDISGARFDSTGVCILGMTTSLCFFRGDGFDFVDVVMSRTNILIVCVVKTVWLRFSRFSRREEKRKIWTDDTDDHTHCE